MVAIERLNTAEINLLQPLIDDFVRAHHFRPVRPDYQEAALNWLTAKAADTEAIVYLARCSTDVCGLSVGTLETNAPLMLPEKIGYVQALVVSSRHRRRGIGKALWLRTKE